MLMNYIEPSTNIKIMKGVPLDNTYRNTILFSSLTEQETYFEGNYTVSGGTALIFDNQTYQRINKGQIRLELPLTGLSYSQFMGFNYLSFKNAGYESKTIYAFITSIDYVNDNTVNVTYEIDVMQTFAFDYVINPCFVERCHTGDDTIGANLIPEGLEHGDYMYTKASKKATIYSGVAEGSASITNYYYSTKTVSAPFEVKYSCETGVFTVIATESGGLDFTIEENATDFSYVTVKDNTTNTTYKLALTSIGMDFDTTKSNWLILVPSTIAINNKEYVGRLRNGIYSGLSLIRFPNVAAANAYLTAVTEAGLADSVVSVSMAPAFIKDETSGATSIDIDDIAMPTTIAGYTPRNKKLLCAPYNVLYVKSSDGNSAQFNYEYFEDPNEPILRMYGAASVTSELALEPVSYKGLYGANDNERINVSSAPLCAFIVDTFRSWLAQTKVTRDAAMEQLQEQKGANKLSNALGAIGSVGAGAALGAKLGTMIAPGLGTALGGVLGAAGGGLLGKYQMDAKNKAYDYQIDNLLNEQYVHSLNPPQSRGSASGSLDIALGMFGYQIYYAQITSQFAKTIDDYLSVYGYAEHRVKTPDRQARRRWCYIRTKGANIGSTGAGCNSEIQAAIAGILDSGITFWRYAPNEFDMNVGVYQDEFGNWFDNSIR